MATFTNGFITLEVSISAAGVIRSAESSELLAVFDAANGNLVMDGYANDFCATDIDMAMMMVCRNEMRKASLAKDQA